MYQIGQPVVEAETYKTMDIWKDEAGSITLSLYIVKSNETRIHPCGTPHLMVRWLIANTINEPV